MVVEERVSLVEDQVNQAQGPLVAATQEWRARMSLPSSVAMGRSRRLRIAVRLTTRRNVGVPSGGRKSRVVAVVEQPSQVGEVPVRRTQVEGPGVERVSHWVEVPLVALTPEEHARKYLTTSVAMGRSRRRLTAVA